MILSVGFFILICGILLVATIRGKDFFPFSHYPMFSARYRLDDVKVFRLALEKQNGEIVWWRSEFYRYPEFVGRRLKRIEQSNGGDEKSKAFASLEKRRLLIEVLRLVEVEDRAFENYTAFHIVERTAAADEKLKFCDRTISVMSFDEIKK